MSLLNRYWKINKKQHNTQWSNPKIQNFGQRKWILSHLYPHDIPISYIYICIYIYIPYIYIYPIKIMSVLSIDWFSHPKIPCLIFPSISPCLLMFMWTEWSLFRMLSKVVSRAPSVCVFQRFNGCNGGAACFPWNGHLSQQCVGERSL